MTNNMTELTKYINHDAANSIFFLRELEQIKPQSYDVEYAPLSCFKMIPTSRSTDRGASIVTYDQYDSTGIAKIVANYADDVPIIGLKGKQFSSKIVTIATSYIISDEDKDASRFAGKSMEQKLIETASETIQQRMNQLAFFGDAEQEVQGWLTNTAVDKQPVAGADAAARLWVNKDGPEMVKDLNQIKSSIIVDTNDVEKPDTIGIPLEQYLLLQNTQYNAGTDTTALQWFLENNPEITIVAANELKGAFGGLDGMVAYKRSERKFWQEVPVTFEMLPAQRQNQVVQVICRARYGGVLIAYPQSQAFRTGI